MRNCGGSDIVQLSSSQLPPAIDGIISIRRDDALFLTTDQTDEHDAERYDLTREGQQCYKAQLSISLGRLTLKGMIKTKIPAVCLTKSKLENGTVR